MHCQPEKKTPAIGPVQHAVDKDTETQVKRLTQGRDIASCLVPEKERQSRSHAILSKPFPHPHYFTKIEFLFCRHKSTGIYLKYDF